MFITLTIEAKESRKIVTIDIPRVFLNTEIKENVIMKMVGTLAELMVKTNPKLYQQYLILEKGKVVLYLQLQKAIWHDEERIVVLQEANIGAAGDGI